MSSAAIHPRHSTHPPGQRCALNVALSRLSARRQSDQGDVYGLGALVPRFLLIGDLRALGQRAKSVPADTAELHEEIAAAAVGRDEAPAPVVAPPLARASR